MNTDYSRVRFLARILLLFLIAATPFQTSTAVEAQLTTEMAVVNPAAQNGDFTFYTNTTSIGERFNATVWVYSVTDLFTYQVNLNVDDDSLNITNAWLPTWNADWVFKEATTVKAPPALYDLDSDGHAETVKIGDAILVGDTFNGDGMLAVVEFTIVDTPAPMETIETELAIDDPDTFLLNLEITDIPTLKTNGRFNLIWLEPELEVKPNEYVAVSEDETFNITIWMNNVTRSDNLVSVSFKFKYNATLLNITAASEGLFFSRFNNTPSPPFTDFQYSFGQDYVNLSLQILPNNGEWTVFPQGSGKIATITLQSIHQNHRENQCPLELSDVQLRDDNENTMTITPPKNGHYTIKPQLSSHLTTNVNPSQTIVGSNVTITGTLKPPETGANISIYTRILNKEWTLLATVKTDLQGNYTHQWTTTQTGTFELKANWTGNQNHPTESTIKQLIIEKTSSILTISAHPLIAAVGSNITVEGKITPTKEDIPVAILYKHTSDTWQTLASANTDSQGNYKYAWKTQRAGSYELYAKWQGDNLTTSTETSKTMVTVEKLASTTSICVFPSVATVGSNVTVNGTVSPVRPGVSVTIYLREVGNESWSKLYTTTNAEGHYNITWIPPKNTTFEFYAWCEGDENIHPDASNLITIEVKLASQLTINIFPSVATVGSNVTVNGTVSPVRPGVSVTIYLREVGNESWSELATVTTDSNSHFSFNWTAQESGQYELKATLPGDEFFKESESSIRVLLVKQETHLPLTTIYAIIAGIGITGIAISLYAYKRRKKKN